MNTSNSNSGTKTPTEEATSSSMNPPPLPVSLPTMTNTTITAATATVEGNETASLFEAAAAGGGGGGPGQGLHGGSGGNHPNSNNTSRNSTAVGGPVLVEPPHPPSSSSSSLSSSTEKKDDDNHNDDSTGNTTDTTAMTTLFLSTSLSSSPVSSARSNTTTANVFTPAAAMSNLVLSTSSSSSSSPVTASMVPTGIVTEKNKTLSEVIAETTAATECVICCYPLPQEEETIYQECCGELVCNGCIIAQRRVLSIGTNIKQPIAGSREEELEFMTMLLSEQPSKAEEWEFIEVLLSEEGHVCPFCRSQPEPTNDNEILKRLSTRIDEYKDPKAMLLMGSFYLKGKHGRSKNLKKAEELFQRSYGLGDPYARYRLAVLYFKHIPDEARMMKYLEEGVKRGDAHCINLLGVRAHQSGNYEEATRQYKMAARSGHDGAMHNLMDYYQKEVLSEEDLATTLRAHHAANDEERSEPREYATRYSDFKEKTLAVNTLIRVVTAQGQRVRILVPIAVIEAL